MGNSNIVLGQTQVTAQNYQDYIKKVQDEANAKQDVTQADLAPLEQFLGMSGASVTGSDTAAAQAVASTLGITLDQLRSMQNDVSGLDTIIQMGSSSGYMNAPSQHGTAVTNQSWANSIDDLISGASAASNGVADPSVNQNSGGLTVNGTVVSGSGAASSATVTYPAATALAQAASVSGATVNYNADNNLFTISSPSGVGVYSGAGSLIGSVPPSGLEINITNPANPSLGYISIDGSGNMTNSSGAAGQFADMTITGTGAGGYATGNTLGVAGTVAGTVTFPPGSDAALFAQNDGTNLSDPNAIKSTPAGAMAIKGKDNQWHVFDQRGVAVGITNTSSGSVAIPAIYSSVTGQVAVSADTFSVSNGVPTFATSPGATSANLPGAASAASSGLNAAGVTNGKDLYTQDGGQVMYRTYNGQSQFAIFNKDGTQAVPPNGGWQTIDPKTNGGKGTVDLGNGQFVNFDLNGFTIDAKNKNKGTPLTMSSFSQSAPATSVASSAASAPALTGAAASAESSMMAAGVTNMQKEQTSDGRTILYSTSNGQSQFAVFNPDGSQQIPTTGWQVIDPKKNGGNGTLDLGNGQYLNFDLNGFTVDSENKNKGTPLNIAQLTGTSAASFSGASNSAYSSMSAGMTGSNQQAIKTAGGGMVLFQNVNGIGEFAIFNPDGSQRVPASGWQNIDPTRNAGNGAVNLGDGSYLNFDSTGITVDNHNKNAGVPMSIVGNNLQLNEAASAESTASTNTAASLSADSSSDETASNASLRGGNLASLK